MKNEFHDKRNRWSGLKVKPLITLVLVLSIIIPIPFFSTAAEELKKFDPDELCSLTVAVNSTEKDEEFADLAEADLVIDLYMVAEAEPNKGSDGYTFVLADSFKDLEIIYEDQDIIYKSQDGRLHIKKDMSAKEWGELSQNAAQKILDVSTGTAVEGIEPYKTTDPAKAKIEIEDLEAGLYLLVVRNDDDKIDEDGYVDTAKDGTTIVTRAFSNLNSYIFLPELVALPTTEELVNGEIDTANTGHWLYDVNVFLKPERESASLKIVKTLDWFVADGGDGNGAEENGEGENVNRNSVTFVFEIKAVLKNMVVYSNVVSIVFDGSEADMEKSIEIPNIPVGATVTIEEVYSGAHYTVEGVQSYTEVPIVSNLTPVEFPFENKYDERQSGGHGITNHFTFDGTGWQWQQIRNASQG